jgi:pectinesterase
MPASLRLQWLLVLAACATATACGGSDAPASTPEAAAPAPAPAPASTPTRPQLTDAQAQDYTATRYLAQAGTLTGPAGAGLTVDNWVPPAVGDVAAFTPTYTVAADGSGTHVTVQAAIDAVPAASTGSARTYILVKPGTYRELVCAKDKAPITLYGADADAGRVTLVNGNYNGKAKTANVDSANPCNPNLSGATYGTSGSASVAIYSHDFHAKNLSFANDAMKDVVGGAGYPAGASGSSGAQGVALMTQGDRLVFENVRVLGNQDTLYVKTPNTGTVSRAYFKGCHVEGDVDFIFGRGTAVLDGCTAHFVSRRLPAGQGTTMIAPSTSPNHAYGFLLVNATLSADAATQPGTIALGRAWDEGVASGSYVAGTSPNGQLLIRNSTLGSHIRAANPWDKSTSGREYSDTGNRFAEHRNSTAP